MLLDDSSLSKLMALSQAGDKAAHEAVLRACQQWLTRYFYGKLPVDQIDDLVQETLISIHRKAGTYDTSRPFAPWVATIARYRWIDRLRQTYRIEKSASESDGQGFNPDDEMTAAISIDRMLELIPQKHAVAITMVKLKGYSISDVARMTGQSESSVKMNISRGIRKLTELVEE